MTLTPILRIAAATSLSGAVLIAVALHAVNTPAHADVLHQTVTAVGEDDVTAQCPVNFYATGGGYEIKSFAPNDNHNPTPLLNRPVNNGTAWQVQLIGGIEITQAVYVLCSSVA